MKIDFIISRLIGGGAERVMVILANYFVQQGHSVRILTLNPYDEFYTIDRKVAVIPLNSFKTPFARLNNFIALLKFYRLKRNRPDLAISFIIFTNMISILACKLYAIPIIVSEHNNHTYKNHPFWLSKIAWRYIYPMANLVTVLTQYDLEYFQRLGAKTFVMPNPCTFDPVLDGHSDRSKTIVAVGNLDRYYQKGFDNLIPIVSKVLEEYPEWDLKIIGAGNRGKRIIEEQIEKTGFADKIKMLGERKDVDLILRESSILILPSRMEGLPMVLLEAMSQGIAVIAYDCVTGPSEIIDDGIDGLLIENQNIKAMQTGLRKLISDDTFRKTLATQGVKKINDYSIEKVYSKWLEAIKSI